MPSNSSNTAEFHYGGEDVLPTASFLRRLPHAVAGETRLRLDALVFSADALQHGWLSLRTVTNLIGADLEGILEPHKIAALVSAWSIVDHLHTVRQLITSLPLKDPNVSPGPLTSALLAACTVASRLRNCMDHLNDNVGNLSRLGGNRSALFGSLSYFFVTKVPPTTGHAIVLQSGRVHSKETWPVVNPAGRVFLPPADLFLLNAFGLDLELGPPIAMLAKWLMGVAEDAEDQIRAQIRSLATTTGHSIEQLMEHGPGGVSVALQMEFGDTIASPANQGTNQD